MGSTTGTQDVVRWVGAGERRVLFSAAVSSSYAAAAASRTLRSPWPGHACARLSSCSRNEPLRGRFPLLVLRERAVARQLPDRPVSPGLEQPLVRLRADLRSGSPVYAGTTTLDWPAATSPLGIRSLMESWRSRPDGAQESRPLITESHGGLP